MRSSINMTHTKLIDTGIATGSAATHAYLSDTTSPANRSGVFSLMLGLLFCGIALGPTLGGLLISETGDLLSVFYIAAALHVIYLLMALFVVPESLTKEAALANAEVATMKAEQDAVLLAKQEENMAPTRKRIHRALRTAFFFLSPLNIFIPHKVEGSRRRDWNLTAVAIGYGLITLLLVSLALFRAELPSNI
jgi:MFS family permease